MNSEWFTSDQVRQLVDLLTVASTATAATSQAPPAPTSSHQPILSAAA